MRIVGSGLFCSGCWLATHRLVCCVLFVCVAHVVRKPNSTPAQRIVPQSPVRVRRRSSRLSRSRRRRPRSSTVVGSRVARRLLFVVVVCRFSRRRRSSLVVVVASSVLSLSLSTHANTVRHTNTSRSCRSGLVFRCGKFFSSALRSVRRTKSLVCGESMRGGGSQNLGEPRQRSDAGVWFQTGSCSCSSGSARRRSCPR